MKFSQALVAKSLIVEPREEKRQTGRGVGRRQRGSLHRRPPAGTKRNRETEKERKKKRHQC